jgi:hypothetical protein
MTLRAFAGVGGKTMKKNVKVRFVAHGIFTIPPDQIPEDWHEWSDEDQWEWLQEWWGLNVTENMLKNAILMDDVPGDPLPGLLEVDEDKGYRTIAMSKEYFAWWNCIDPSDLYRGEA